MKPKHPSLPTAILLAVGALKVAAAGTEIISVSASPQVKFHTIGLAEARWTGGFWGERWEQDCRVTIPSMKQVMELPTNSATFHNLRVAAGEIPGKFFGNHWGDGDCYKWIEAAASIYALNHDPGVDRQMDEVIAVITKAQAPDGYISTQIQLTDKGRWTNLNHHELYSMGHLQLRDAHFAGQPAAGRSGFERLAAVWPPTRARSDAPVLCVS